MKLSRYRESRLATVLMLTAAAVSAGCGTFPNGSPNYDPSKWSSDNNDRGADHGGSGGYHY